ncbi:hypothetical protein TSUD_410480 [Trifolium subterraneum]|uniref:Retrotransposon gag domain-containing protein n=1 Tax=Trifolium subterraneum TaxID=3900 RepID=A0A2Z6PJ75_TRISU|nr:hypothetical protein TSUD_410480 [Trifolium subterraneum]
MEILTSIIGKVVDYIVVPIGRQASYLIFYKGNFKMLADDVKDLQAARERVVHSVEEESGNGKEIEKDVKNWLEKVDELIETANQLQQDPRRADVRCSSWRFPNLILRHQLSRKAKKIANNVVQVQGKGTFDRVGYLPTIDGTNLVEKVKIIAEQLKLFDKVVKAEVTENPDFKRIQGEIADSLGLRFDEETIFGRANRLRERIKMEKSILVILDNIWSMLDLKKVGIPIGNEHNGCKLLMTSRNQDVLVQMDVPNDFTFKLELMSENETWNLFQSMVGDVIKDNNLKDVAIQVAQKCEGLPLRVVTVACAMKNKRDVQSWKYGLQRLQSNAGVEMDVKTYSALELSYDFLESDEMRDLLLLLALCLCNVAYCLKLTMSLDTLKHIITMDDARNRLYTIIKSLEAACFLEVKTNGHIQMHDFVRDFANSVAQGLKNLKILSLRKSSMIKLPKVIGKLTQLRMLDLSHSGIEVVPSNIISNLTKLEELYMGNTSINWEDANSTVQSENASIAELQKLPNLTALELQIRETCMLPRDLRLMFEKLERYKIAIGNVWEWSDIMVAFPKLDTLNLNKIWDGNYDSMHNLTSLIVDNCGGLKFLFSSTVVGSFKNLKHLEISNCAMMEEIIAKEEENNALEEVHFLKLEKIIVKDMDNLKTIWHHQFETVKMLQLNNCDKIVVVFPSSMQKTYNKLEMLEVTNCALVEEIFELNFKESSSVEDTTHLKKIWSGDPQGILSFQNLSIVKVKSCEGLEYLLPLSIATRCSHLKELHIKNCGNMKEIVVEEKESSGVNATPIFVYNQLRTLSLWNLHRLKGFFAKKHTLACPSLKIIDVFYCPKLTLYKTLSTRSSNIRDDELFVSTQQPLFIVEEVIPNLEKSCKDANIILQAQNSSGLFTKMTSLSLSGYKNEDTFPYWFLQNVRGLKELVIVSSCFKKIFQDEGQIREKTPTQIKQLTLSALPNLEHICEEVRYGSFETLFPTTGPLDIQISKQDDFPMNHPLLQDLNELWVWDCPSLISLAPSSTSFTNLTSLEVDNCNELNYLMTSSTAKSLIQLTTLKIKNCEKMLDVVKIDDEKADQEDIIFENLEYMKFTSMSSLGSFCYGNQTFIFPSLLRLSVKECPQMEIFSSGVIVAPYLTEIEVGKGTIRWEGDINTTIQHLFLEKEVLHSNALNENIISSHLQGTQPPSGYIWTARNLEQPCTTVWSTLIKVKISGAVCGNLIRENNPNPPNHQNQSDGVETSVTPEGSAAHAQATPLNVPPPHQPPQPEDPLVVPQVPQGAPMEVVMAALVNTINMQGQILREQANNMRGQNELIREQNRRLRAVEESRAASRVSQSARRQRSPTPENNRSRSRITLLHEETTMFPRQGTDVPLLGEITDHHRGAVKQLLVEAMPNIPQEGNPRAAGTRGTEDPFREESWTFHSHEDWKNPQHWTSMMGRLTPTSMSRVCKLFPLFLVRGASTWWRNLPPGSIDSWEELCRTFTAHFTTSRRHPKTVASLKAIVQGPEESLRNYIERFNKVSVEVEATDKMKLYLLEEGLREGTKFQEAVGILEVQTLDAFFELAQRYIKYEDKQKASEVRRPKTFEFTYHTPLNAPRDRILSEISNAEFKSAGIRFPKQLPAKPNVDKKKFCRFHKSYGHVTDDCVHLKDAIEILVQKGYARQYVDGQPRAANNNAPRQNQLAVDPASPEQHVEDENRVIGGVALAISRPEDFLHLQTDEEKGALDYLAVHLDGSWENFPGALVISGGGFNPITIGSIKRKFDELEKASPVEEIKITEVRESSVPLAFYREEVPGGSPNFQIPLLVRAKMANFDVRRILVDQGSSCDIMYSGLFKVLQLSEENLVPYVGSDLQGFNGSTTKPWGYVDLIVTFGENKAMKSVKVKFLVVDCPSPQSTGT